ncbi:hypothetical protein EGW08_020942 [Elysia chlorotica]|uniref:Cytidyltransferase-like domain-containing protein n=1 Tax=Elysia chlorotica TaxID=188477 RepID=A0A3S1AY27_ELYCH|nr:hypothetical protein EGW08_020942 [Elysia chlorotica]
MPLHVRWYDEYMYSPLQATLWPVVAALPRSLTVDGRSFDVFTANIVSWSRTFLVIPIAWSLKEFKKTDELSTKASTASVMEGKLKEKLESMGIAALCVAQSNTVPLESLSGVVGVSCLLLSVRLAHSSLMSKLQAREPLLRSHKHASDDEDEIKTSNRTSTDSLSELVRTFVFIRPERDVGLSNNAEKLNEEVDSDRDECLEKTALQYENHPGLARCMSMPGTRVLQDTSLDARAERVYTVGCFDLFHHGHIALLQRMRKFGKKVVVGVHDSRSIYHLKNRVPIDSTLTRMRNVKQFADEASIPCFKCIFNLIYVFCVAGTDPTPFLDFIFDKENQKENAIYIRGNDMPQFPARHLCESLMTVKLLPYTQGVSSTKIRKHLLDSSNYDIFDGTGGVMLY